MKQVGRQITITRPSLSEAREAMFDVLEGIAEDTGQTVMWPRIKTTTHDDGDVTVTIDFPEDE